MTKDIRSITRRARLAYGLGCIALGCYPLALSVGLLPTDGTAPAPMWVIALTGFIVVLAGFMILFARHSRINDLLAGVMLFMFALIGIWVAVFSPSEGFSGGFAVLPVETNVLTGRWVFGFGAAICLAMSVYAFRRAASKPTQAGSKTTV